MKDFKFSVIIPAYNSEAFIGETVECLINQTLKEIQIIIVEDGATDSTAQIADDFSVKYKNITVIHQPNGGVSSARNHGINYAEGKYTLFLDSDDLLSADALERIYNRMEEKNADMAIFRMRRFGFGSEEDNPIAKELSQEDYIDRFDKRLVWNFLIGNKAFRTSMLKNSDVRFPSTRYSEDGAFNMSFIYKLSPVITGVPGAVAKYRRCDPEEHPSVTQTVNMVYVKDFIRSLDIIKAEAEIALEKEDCTCNDKDDYRQELIVKTYCTLMNEFYRLLWGADDETLAFISEKCRELRSQMKPEKLKFCDEKYKELGIALASRKEIAEKPFLSVKIRNAKPANSFLKSMFHQSLPMFELLIKDMPEDRTENIHPASDNPKGKVIISLSGKKSVDSRLFRVIFFLKENTKLGILPAFVIKHCAFLFLKFKK